MSILHLRLQEARPLSPSSSRADIYAGERTLSPLSYFGRDVVLRDSSPSTLASQRARQKNSLWDAFQSAGGVRLPLRQVQEIGTEVLGLPKAVAHLLAKRAQQVACRPLALMRVKRLLVPLTCASIAQ